MWPLVQQYAPELRQQFFDLELPSRDADEDLALPTPESLEQEYKEKVEKQVNKELESDQPDRPEKNLWARVHSGHDASVRRELFTVR